LLATDRQFCSGARIRESDNGPAPNGGSVKWIFLLFTDALCRVAVDMMIGMLVGFAKDYSDHRIVWPGAGKRLSTPEAGCTCYWLGRLEVDLDLTRIS
jgi:hypothetical protein